MVIPINNNNLKKKTTKPVYQSPLIRAKIEDKNMHSK